MQFKKQQLEMDMEQQTGSKSGKDYIKDVYCIILYNIPCLFKFCVDYIMQNARLDEAQAQSKLPGEISITSDTQMTPP